MCLSTVLNEAHQPICKNIAAVTAEDGKLVFTDIMGVSTVVAGSIEKIDLTENLIYVMVKNAAHK